MKATSITTSLIFATLSYGHILAQSSNPAYSVAVYLHKDPIAYLLDAEARMNQGDKLMGHPFPDLEVLAAKAALEAGDNTKALTYATEALATAQAREADRKQRGFKEAQKHDGISESYYYVNFVFGRLAILKGDIRGAEQYLLASGQTIGGPVTKPATRRAGKLWSSSLTTLGAFGGSNQRLSTPGLARSKPTRSPISIVWDQISTTSSR
jgi:hypothetical protein